jgi:hypothetical protein
VDIKSKGRQKKNKTKTANVRSTTTYVLYLARIELLYTHDGVIFFNRVFEFPSSRNAQKPKTP